MPKDDRAVSPDEGTVMLHLLGAVDRQSNITQRSLAAELGVPLGLAALYISSSFEFHRQARQDCEAAADAASASSVNRIKTAASAWLQLSQW